MALLFLDLDHFKVANDSLGHSVGDALLRAVAERLQECMRPGDTVARLGGDEFAMLMPNLLDAGEAAWMAQRIIDRIGDEFEIDAHRLQVGVSIGITLCPGDDRQAEQLLRKADLAMYHAKSEGRNTFRFFTDRLHAELVERKAMLDQLALALAQQQFELHYQPVLNARGNELHGIEALVRWRHPTLGLVTPERFIPLAEQSGLIVPLGHWILTQAIADLARWDQAELPPVRLAINLSLAQFRDPALVERLQAALSTHQVAAARVELELTETVLMHDLDDAIAIMARLRGIGLGLAVDDFGTGYSSLSYLKRFPVQKLKIDKSFVRGVATDEGFGRDLPLGHRARAQSRPQSRRRRRGRTRRPAMAAGPPLRLRAGLPDQHAVAAGGFAALGGGFESLISRDRIAPEGAPTARTRPLERLQARQARRTTTDHFGGGGGALGGMTGVDCHVRPCGRCATRRTARPRRG
jgi:diguanylate cyclase (GGDEF)-like protein